MDGRPHRDNTSSTTRQGLLSTSDNNVRQNNTQATDVGGVVRVERSPQPYIFGSPASRQNSTTNQTSNNTKSLDQDSLQGNGPSNSTGHFKKPYAKGARGKKAAAKPPSNRKGARLTPEQMDELALGKLRFLKDRMEEWKTNDYIPEEDTATIDTETFDLAGELLQVDPEKFSQLNEYDATAPGQSVWEADESDKRKLKENEVSFSEFISKKRSTWNSNTGDISESGSKVEEEGEEQRVTKESLDQDSLLGGGESTESKPLPKNIIRLEDPDDLLISQPVGTFKPSYIRPEFLSPESFESDNPGQFLSKTSFMGLTSVKNLGVFLNKYRLNKDTDYWNESQLEKEFCSDIMRYVREKYSMTRNGVSITFVFFVELPLFVYCVFKRVITEREKKYKLKPGEKDVPPKRRKYAWAGYRLCMGRDGSNDDDEKPAKPLAPSSFQSRSSPNITSPFTFSPLPPSNEEGWM